MNWSQLVPLLATVSPENFAAFCQKLPLTEIENLFYPPTPIQRESFTENFIKINGVSPETLGELLLFSIDGDFLLATAQQTFVLPKNLLQTDVEIFPKSYQVFLSDYFAGQPLSKILPQQPLAPSAKLGTKRGYYTVVTPDQKKIVTAMLQEKALSFKRQGQKQWQDLLSENPRHDLTQAIQRGEVYFLKTPQQEVFGMLALWQTPTSWDQNLWLDSQLNHSCLYLHRLVVRNAFKGQNLGEVALQLAEEIAKARGFYCIRLDCASQNSKLREFYQKNGYTLANLDKKTGFAMYQKFFR